MYDFKSFKNAKEIKKNLNDYLIFVKRLLPRWADGIPDAELMALFQSCKKLKKRPIIVETGIGASTLAFVLISILRNGKVYSWDTNGSKGFFLNSVMVESFGKSLGVDINKYWTFVAASSTSKFTGIDCLKEKKVKSNFCFLDSYHTWENVKGELVRFLKIADNNFILAIDDAYYKYKKYNIPMINMLRTKLNLELIEDFKSNICESFFTETKNFLGFNKLKFKEIKTNFPKEIKGDLFLKYYMGDRKFMNKLKMEEKNKLLYRMKILKVSKK